MCAFTVYHNRHVSDNVYLHTYINIYTYIHAHVCVRVQCTITDTYPMMCIT